MKLLVNDKMYVQYTDLVFLTNLPNFVIEEMSKENTHNGLEEFTSKESIEYFNSRDEIIDYNVIKNLSEEALYDYIHSLHELFFRINNYHYKNHREKRKMEICEYKVEKLKDYIDYKKVYDKQFELVIEGGLTWLKKKKSLKKN